jgi:hypothetical protein
LAREGDIYDKEERDCLVDYKTFKDVGTGNEEIGELKSWCTVLILIDDIPWVLNLRRT